MATDSNGKVAIVGLVTTYIISISVSETKSMRFLTMTSLRNSSHVFSK